jgi:hypothetical protein
MKKYTRIKRSGEEIDMVTAEGRILTIAPISKKNTNGNEYYTFCAKLDQGNGKELTCLGQVYQSSVDYLGGMPKQGDKYVFVTELDQLLLGNNKVWSILSQSVDNIDEAVLAQLDELFADE